MYVIGEEWEWVGLVGGMGRSDVGQLWCVGVVVWGSCGVWELRCGGVAVWGVAVWGSRGVGESRCGRVAMWESRSKSYGVRRM